MRNDELLKGARAFNSLNGIENTRRNVNNTKSILKDFINMNEWEKRKKYITLDELLKYANLKEIKEKYECYYIKYNDKDVFIDIRRIPAKHNKTRYVAVGIDFIRLLEDNNIECEEIL